MKPDAVLWNGQWQGVGRANDIPRGARLLRGCVVAGAPCLEAPVRAPNEAVGDAPIRYREQILTQARAVKALLAEASPRAPLTLGGDCGVDLVSASYAAMHHPGVGLIWIDAHADMNTPETSPSGRFHGMPLRALLGEGDPDLLACRFAGFSPDRVILAGLREADPAEIDFIGAAGVAALSTQALRADPGVVADLAASKGWTQVYVHLDLDVLDPGEFPAVSAPARDGLAAAMLIDILRALAARQEIVGMSVTEFAPREEIAPGPLGHFLRTIASALDAAGFGSAIKAPAR